MNERIKAIRKEKGITQQKMAQDLNIGQSMIANIENGARDPSDRTIADICRVYDVNEIWLRTGVGEMFQPRTREEEITDFLADVLRDQPESLRKRLVLSLSRLTPEQWDLLDQLLDQIMEDIKKDRPDG